MDPLNWRALVWRLATWVAGPQPVRLNLKVRSTVTLREASPRLLNDERWGTS